ncbi:hypothetical protein MRX96_038382 [Rhipicephalus microplus]
MRARFPPPPARVSEVVIALPKYESFPFAQIDRQIAELARQECNVIKILLLGAGESGKSTIVKQMKIIHSEGFSDEELRSFRPTVLDNLLGSMKYVLTGMGILRINLENPKNKMYAQTVLSCQCCFDESITMLPFVDVRPEEPLERQGCPVGRRTGLRVRAQRLRAVPFENMDRLCSEKYMPTPRDVLRARVRTNGIIETHFKIDDIVFRMFDVGGQRSERRKWIQCFDDVKAVLYVVALSGYDMTLQEDPNRVAMFKRLLYIDTVFIGSIAFATLLLIVVPNQSANQAITSFQNRLHESLKLFSSICNNMFFTDTSMILFLNKLDLFREKILYSDRHLRYYLPDYKGADYDVDSGALFIQHKFQSRNRDPNKVAMDTVLRGNLRTATLL